MIMLGKPLHVLLHSSTQYSVINPRKRVQIWHDSWGNWFSRLSVAQFVLLVCSQLQNTLQRLNIEITQRLSYLGLWVRHNAIDDIPGCEVPLLHCIVCLFFKIAWSADSRLICSGSADSTLKVSTK